MKPSEKYTLEIQNVRSLIEKLKARTMLPPPGGVNTGTGMSMETTSQNIPINPGSGNASLQRALNREGV